MGVAQTRTVHRNAVTDMVENVAFMHCPPERKVTVPVPIKAWALGVTSASKMAKLLVPVIRNQDGGPQIPRVSAALFLVWS